MYEPVPMLPPMSTGCPTGRKRVGQARVSRPECAGRALAVDEEIAALSVDGVRFDLAGIVGDVEQKAQIVPWEEMGENTPGVVSENLTIGERAIDCRPAWRRDSAGRPPS